LNLDYIRGFQGSGTVTHNVFVDPGMIGAFTNDGTGALRVLEYFVHSSFAGVNKSMYHSSDYAKMTDDAYLVLFNEAVAAHTAEQKKVQEVFDELDALKTI
jgi:hypothetical protein